MYSTRHHENEMPQFFYVTNIEKKYEIDTPTTRKIRKKHPFLPIPTITPTNKTTHAYPHPREIGAIQAF